MDEITYPTEPVENNNDLCRIIGEAGDCIQKLARDKDTNILILSTLTIIGLTSARVGCFSAIGSILELIVKLGFPALALSVNDAQLCREDAEANFALYLEGLEAGFRSVYPVLH